MKLPIIHFSPTTETLSADILKRHDEVSRWFDEHPERKFHIVVPSIEIAEEYVFDVVQKDEDPFYGMWIMSEYGFVPYMLYSREPTSGDQPECILKRGLMIHSSFLMSDDDHTLDGFSRLADDQYAIFPVPRFIEKDEFWRCHKENPERLMKDLWS